jgi:hypothetical protein
MSNCETNIQWLSRRLAGFTAIFHFIRHLSALSARLARIGDCFQIGNPGARIAGFQISGSQIVGSLSAAIAP